ncbi:MAG: pantoate--beta-alanine ligase, partial [Gemmatimonadetes bacterium]|nr:4-phosphopantoate--beta-alanine ligase [Gemmatimonadota bacterium]NIT67000.1 4-phosphopantoate--beta-alanine ligase [Gemmatimonadota bacterium]NIV23792.1 pantoate--beta-alanine ligase [Gemmatimonadota bacterium]NIW75680.1 pantoate--beta-alanine ligase [Gemmatimonadota bacterium]NIY35577.1 pantoate--beta-alanine ligase [Gemmatimonadota bacterium]
MIDEPRPMIEISDPAQMRSWSRARRAEGRSVGFVPTMGYLHEGHLRLVDRAQASAALVVVSAFVNPLQFGPGEDFERYPRDPEHDREAAVSRGVACLFIPGQPQMYASPAIV